MMPTTRPGTPSARNAARQPRACATAPAIFAPNQAPIGAPSASTVIAMGRRSAGKQSDTMAVDGGVPPASPAPTPMRPSKNSQYVRDSPHSAVKADQTIREAAKILRRLERSANQEIRMPKDT